MRRSIAKAAAGAALMVLAGLIYFDHTIFDSNQPRVETDYQLCGRVLGPPKCVSVSSGAYHLHFGLLALTFLLVAVTFVWRRQE